MAMARKRPARALKVRSIENRPGPSPQRCDKCGEIHSWGAEAVIDLVPEDDGTVPGSEVWVLCEPCRRSLAAWYLDVADEDGWVHVDRRE